jgi:hypothetical protein
MIPPEAPPPILAPPEFRAPVALGWDGTAAEPAIVVAPDGTIYVAAAPRLWRSTDGGGSFEALGEASCVRVGSTCLPGSEFTRAPLDGFGGDADLAVDANGTLYFVGLYGESGTLPFQLSRDRGSTWTPPIDLAEGNRTDRQWLEALPDGTLYLTWRDFGAPDDEAAMDQILFRRSLDGGATWEPTRAAGPDALQGPLAIDARSGAIYYAFYKAGIRVARSHEAGETWTQHDAAPETRDMMLRQGRPLDMFPISAVDRAGAIYVVWAADLPDEAPMGAKEATTPRVWLIASTDEGATWSKPRALSPEGKAAVFPWIVAGKEGHVAITWYEARAGTPSHVAPDVWDVILVESGDASGPEPAFAGGMANNEPVHVGAICRSGGGCDAACSVDCVPTRLCAGIACVGKDRSRLEFFEMALTPEGHPILAWVADAQAPAPGIEIHFGGVSRGTPMT